MADAEIGTFFVCHEVGDAIEAVEPGQLTLLRAIEVYDQTPVGSGGPVAIYENTASGPSPTRYRKYDDPKPPSRDRAPFGRRK